MERIIWKHQSIQPFYVFNGRTAVQPWDDGFSFSAVAHWYQDTDSRTSALLPPHVYLKALPLASYTALVLNDRLPIDVAMSGPNVGFTKLTSGYSEADLGAYQRHIVNQQTRLFCTSEALAFVFAAASTPVDPSSAHAILSEEDKSAKTFNFEFQVPFEYVPEFLNFTERERRSFLRLRAASVIHS